MTCYEKGVLYENLVPGFACIKRHLPFVSNAAEVNQKKFKNGSYILRTSGLILIVHGLLYFTFICFSINNSLVSVNYWWQLSSGMQQCCYQSYFLLSFYFPTFAK